MIRPRMAMDKLKQALGLQITDEQLLRLLKDDYENMDIGNDQHLVPYLEPPPASGDLQDYADLVQELQGRGLY